MPARARKASSGHSAVNERRAGEWIWTKRRLNLLELRSPKQRVSPLHTVTSLVIVRTEKGETCSKGVEAGGAFDVFGELTAGLLWPGGL
jgi:hypothetical protein